MAKLAFTFTFLFLLFAISAARQPLDLTETKVLNRDSFNSFPDSDGEPTILLPSENPAKSDSDATAEHLPTSDMVDVGVPTRVLPGAVTIAPGEPGTAFVRFRPINRHFIVNRQFPLRFSRRRPCRQFRKPMIPRFHDREISYGNDMISSGENSDFDQEMFHRQMPSKWLRRHHHHHNGFMPNHMFAREELNRPFSHGEEREEGGFMRRVRKFFNRF